MPPKAGPPPALASGANTLIGRYEHLAKRTHHEKAKELLLRTGSLVKPIMKKHDWKVGTLAEFVPNNPNLLGMNQNRGFKILLRLRPHEAQDTFYDQDQLVLVMLHELTHNVHGPHDAKFYKLLGELEEEYYELKRKGYSGEGFFSEGARLGGSHGVPQHIGRIKALEAAEKRVAKQILIGKGGKLGQGPGSRQGRTMREVLLEATERRLKDDKSCAHESADVDVEARKAAAESEGQDAADAEKGWAGAIDVDALDSDSDGEGTDERVKVEPPALTDVMHGDVKPNIKSSSSAVRPIASPAQLPVSKSPAKPPLISAAAAISKPPAKKPRIVPPTVSNSASSPSVQRNIWTCATCTLDNHISDHTCQACGQAKPAPPGFWTCDFCTTVMEADFRCCRGCGYVRRI